MKHPNFVLFITDQQRADHLGCYGNAILKTPHIDTLALSGSRFTRTYVGNPVCMPNRGSIMTGRISSVHGARGNGVPLPLESVTFADLLAEAGYHTALIGKSHLQNMEDKPSLLPMPPIPTGTQASTRYVEARRDHYPEAAYEQELRSRWENPNHRIALPYYGFQDVVLCDHHGDECFGDWLRWLRTEQPDLASKLGRTHGIRDSRYIAPQAWHTHLDELSYPTHYIAQQTRDWIRQHTREHPDQPFAIMCSFPDPHHPWTPPGRYWDMYAPTDIPVPPSMRTHGEEPQHVRWLRAERERGDAKIDGTRLFAASEREVREMTALTYGMISNIDDRIGMVMDSLKTCGVDDNTVVIFTSDHGDLMGDHGLVLKGPVHYQGLIRVPFIWREPTKTGVAAVRDDLVSSIDLPVTILNRAGIAPVNGMQGRALFSSDGVAAPSERDAVLIEENQQRAYLGFERPVQIRTVVSESHRMSVYMEGNWGELYDLKNDPLELHNLWDAPQAQRRKTQLLERLARLMIEYSDLSPRPKRIA